MNDKLKEALKGTDYKKPNSKGVAVSVLVILFIVFFFFIIPPFDSSEPSEEFRPSEREIIKLELTSTVWSDPIIPPLGHCILYEKDSKQKITVQYRATPESDWEFYNSPDSKGFLPSNSSGLRFRAVYKTGFIFYEVRPSGQCSKGVMPGVGDVIMIKVVLAENSWSHEVKLPGGMCIKWWGEGTGKLHTQVKSSKYQDWINRADYRSYKNFTYMRWKAGDGITAVFYQLRPDGQCRD